MSEHPPQPQPVWWKQPVDVAAHPHLQEAARILGGAAAELLEQRRQQARPARVGDGVGDGEVSHAA